MKPGPSDFQSLHDIVIAMENKAILVVGDIMLDRFIYGDVYRISPESPVPVLTVRDENVMLGGVGNVLANLLGLGAQPLSLAVIGEDEPGRAVRRLLAEHGADDDGLVAEPGRSTTVKTRFLAAHQQLLRTDAETVAAIDDATEAALLKKFSALLPRAGAVVLSDYGKGVLTKSLLEGMITAARVNGIPVLVDPKGADYTIYRGAAIVTPNRKELAEATNLPVKTDAEVAVAARTLMEKTGIGAVVATRSQDGMTIVQPGAEPVHLRTEAREVFDVSGAGDTVIATMAAALAAGADLVQAAAIANSAAGLVVAKVGTASVRRAELLAALDRTSVGLTPRAGSAVVDATREAPLCDWDEAAEIVRRWKARGLKVGFTNGCFDILHQGHVSYLNRARDVCDKLIVALNADESVRRLKGAERPVNAESSRAVVLGGLGAIDMVVLFGGEAADGDKPLRLLQRLKPDLYFKGGDYAAESLEETPLVRGWGGAVAIMPFHDGHSTTATIRKLKGVA